MKGNNLQKM